MPEFEALRQTHAETLARCAALAASNAHIYAQWVQAIEERVVADHELATLRADQKIERDKHQAALLKIEMDRDNALSVLTAARIDLEAAQMQKPMLPPLAIAAVLGPPAKKPTKKQKKETESKCPTKRKHPHSPTLALYSLRWLSSKPRCRSLCS